MGRLEASLQASVARPQLESVLRELQSSRAAGAALAAELQADCIDDARVRTGAQFTCFTGTKKKYKY